MSTVQQKLKKLFHEAKETLKREKEETISSVRFIGQLDKDNAAVNLGFANIDKFIAALGISRKKYYTRVYADRILSRFPELLQIWRNGETHLSCIALLHSKITEANSEKILQEIKGKTKQELEFFLSTIDFNGETIEREKTIEVLMTFTEAEIEKIERAKDVLAASGHNPSNKEAFMCGIDDLLSRRDPLQKAERAQKRAIKKEKSKKTKLTSKSISPGKQGEQKKIKRKDPRFIAAVVKHATWIRDKGKCTYKNAGGESCGQTKMLEFEHLIPVCRGGTGSIENITLRCRFHNQHEARRLIGEKYFPQPKG